MSRCIITFIIELNNKIRFTMDYNKQIASYESRIDYLEAELSYLNRLLVDVGFPEGIVTLKLSAEELLKEKSHTES